MQDEGNGMEDGPLSPESQPQLLGEARLTRSRCFSKAMQALGVFGFGGSR